MIYRLSLIILIVLSLSACVKEETSNELTNNQIKVLIDNQNKQIEDLKIEIEDLRQSLNEGELIQPFNLDNRHYYSNSRMPFGISLLNESNLPFVVYAYDTHLVIYYGENMNEFIEGYSIVPSFMGKENNDDPEFFDLKDIVKKIDDTYVVVRTIRLGTDLDEETNKKVEEVLKSIKFY